jgi:hypothetical protein
VRPLAEEAESAVRGQGFRGQRPEQLEEAQLEEKEEEEGHQPMFKSFPISGAPRHGSAPDRNAEITGEVPRYLSILQKKLYGEPKLTLSYSSVGSPALAIFQASLFLNSPKLTILWISFQSPSSVL